MPCGYLCRFNIPVMDVLFFYPRNIDPALGRAVLARNFSAISPGVVVQVGGWKGSAHGRVSVVAVP
jgi:hypothetical protein